MNKYRLKYEILDGSDDVASCESFAENLDEAIEKFKKKFGKTRRLLFVESLDKSEPSQVFMGSKSITIKGDVRKIKTRW